MKAIVYNLASGEILRSIEGIPEMLDLQAGEGEAVLVSEADSFTHHVVAGELVEYTLPEAFAKRQEPTHSAAWSNTTMEYVDLRTLSEVKADRWNEIKAERDLRETAGFPYLGKIIDSDPRSAQRITTAVQAAQAAAGVGAPFEIEWTTQDSTGLSLDAPGMMGMPVALAIFANSLHQTARTLRTEIDDAETIEAVKAIAWPA